MSSLTVEGILLLVLVVTFVGTTTAKKRCKYYGYNLDPEHNLSKNENVPFLHDCCQMCLGNPQCKGFVHNRDNNCLLKYNDGPLVGDGRDDGLSTSSGIIEDVDDETLKYEAKQEPLKSCERLPHKNLDPGHDLRVYERVLSFDECCDLCRKESACKGFVHNNHRSCYLKFNDGQTIEDLRWDTNTGIIRFDANTHAKEHTPPIQPTPAPTPSPAPSQESPKPEPKPVPTPAPTLPHPPLAVPPASPEDARVAAKKYGPVCRPFRLRSVKYEQMDLFGYNVSPGRDITVLHSSSSFERCAKACMRCNGCVAFVYDRTDRNCYLKDNSKIVEAGDGDGDEYHGLSIGILSLSPES